jgi:hypothetical protein
MWVVVVTTLMYSKGFLIKLEDTNPIIYVSYVCHQVSTDKISGVS